jgi:hypothetical protein
LAAGIQGGVPLEKKEWLELLFFGFGLLPENIFLRDQPIAILLLCFPNAIHVLFKIAAALGEHLVSDAMDFLNYRIVGHEMSLSCPVPYPPEA